MRTVTAVAALLLATTTAPLAFAQAPSPDALYAEGVNDRLAGRHSAAITKLEAVLVARPDDVDARLNLGLALLAEGRLDEADEAFKTVLLRAPTYADAQVGRARVAQRRGDLATAQTLARDARVMRPDDADIAALETTLAGSAVEGGSGGWRLDVGYGYSALSKGLPSWTETVLSLSRGIEGGRTLGLGIEASERFGASDVFVEGRYEQRLSRGGFYLALGGTRDADYRPEVAFRAGGDLPLGGGGTVFTLDAGVARYPSGAVSSLHPGLQQALLNGRLIVGGRWINVLDETDEHRSGYSVRASWSVIPTLRLNGGYADAPESTEGVTVDVRATSLGFEADLSERFTLRVNGLHEERDAYDRDEVAVGFALRL